MRRKLYIVNDVECTGWVVGFHSVISWGACVVTQEDLPYDERVARGLTFYSEMKPATKNWNLDAMRVACTGITNLEGLQGDPRYVCHSPEFDPALTLQLLEFAGEPIHSMAHRFERWLMTLTGGDADVEVVPIVDTTFFDPGFIQHLFGLDGWEKTPYGYAGIDLDSMYRGMTGRMDANLRELGLVDKRATAHRSLDDAMFLADIARTLIFEKMKNA